MDNSAQVRFLIIDDDPINNHICAMYIDLVFPGAIVESFTNPQLALDHILQQFSDEPQHKTVVLLDINMPLLNGWEVLEKFAHFPGELIKQYTIYILSSSIAAEDKYKADRNPLVAGFLEKPLSVELLHSVFGIEGAAGLNEEDS